LNDSYPLEEERKAQVVSNFLISVLVVVVLAVFRPFGLDNLPYQMAKQIPIYFGYGLITLLICTMADFIIKPAFPVFFDELRWTVKKNIVWVVFLVLFISVGSLFYSNALGFTGISGSSLLQFQFYIVFVTVIPVTLITLLNRFWLLNRNLRYVKLMNESLLKPVIKPAIDSTLYFSSENEKEILKISPDQFLFAEAADTFTDIVYIENGIVKRNLLQSTLSRIEEANASDFVIRIHRAYLVNLYKVSKVSGNAQGYRLIFENVDETVPVSKRCAKMVRTLLPKMHG
jgi:hypothetical protein